MDKLAILGLQFEEFRREIMNLGHPNYRAQQVFHWLYRRGAIRFDQMQNLPQCLRSQLDNMFCLQVGTAESRVIADDGTKKFLIRFPDGEAVECAGIPDGPRLTVCVSSQIGCKMACSFCATGQTGFSRSLAAAEITFQVLYIQQQMAASRQINVVFMGMGEPFDNYDHVLKAISVLHEPAGMNLGMRHMTISTVGLPNSIRRFAQERIQVRLAVSLHAADDQKRAQIMPISTRYPLDELMDACKYYEEVTGRRITYEYAVIDKFNDRDSDAKRLASLLHGLRAHVNLLTVNPVDPKYQPVPRQRLQEFQNILKDFGVETSIRTSRGAEIQAACGQLRQREEKFIQ